MKRYLLFFIIFFAVLSCFEVVSAQEAGNRSISNGKITIPPDSSANNNFCICKIVSFTSDHREFRTDAIFASSTQEDPLTKKDLQRKIRYELQQAMLFFDSYKLIGEYAVPVHCSALYKFLRTKHENINRFTLLLPSYAAR